MAACSAAMVMVCPFYLLLCQSLLRLHLLWEGACIQLKIVSVCVICCKQGDPVAVDLPVYTGCFSAVVLWKLQSLLGNVNLLSYVALGLML